MSLSNIAFIIPIAACVLLLVFFRRQTVWWEYLLVALPSFLLIFGMRLIMVSYNTSANEYWGDYVDHVQHYDHWDEWITKTCSYESCSGSGKDKTCTTVYYDCSYREDHPEYWTKVTEKGKEIVIDETEYNKLVRQFHSRQQFVEMSRDFYRIDGDAQRYDWLKDTASTEPMITEHRYTNKVKASNSLFKFEKITPAQVKQWQLYEYPEVTDYHQATVIGSTQPAEKTQRKFDYINGFFGPEKQVHLFIIFYKNKPYEVVHKQLSYWSGGGKNELIIYIGTDAAGKMQWYDATSWMDKPECTSRIKTYLSGQTTVNLDSLADFLIPTVHQHWARKHFKDFDYIHVEVTPTQLTWIFITLLLYNIGMSIWVVKNNIKYF